jgi:hypothetical protein
MIASKMSVLKPLIQSAQGQHLTAYLTNDQNVFQLKRQLRETLDTAYEYLAPIMNPDALVKFLAPLHNTIEDNELLKSFKGNIGLFRNENLFRILSLPVPVEQTCVIATSFHVKPLLRWMQVDREFLFLGINKDSVSLYQGNQNNFQLLDTHYFSNSLLEITDPKKLGALKKYRLKGLKNDRAYQWLSEWLHRLSKDTRPQLFFAGPKELTTFFLQDCHYGNKRTHAIWPSFSPELALEICTKIRNFSKNDAEREAQLALLEFYQAEDFNLANKNIFQIAKAAIKGKVKKLIVADGINIFGKLNKQSGGLSIHPAHLDHEDDDILDDLAQEVLAKGGQVVVIPREDIPKGRPILAILEKPDHFIEYNYFERGVS